MTYQSQAVSVSLPTWEANVGYEKGESWVVDKMQCGYPRFFIHPHIQKLAASIVTRHGSPDTEKAMLFPSKRSAARCVDFIVDQHASLDQSKLRMLEFVPNPDKLPEDASKKVLPRVCAVVYPSELYDLEY